MNFLSKLLFTVSVSAFFCQLTLPQSLSGSTPVFNSSENYIRDSAALKIKLKTVLDTGGKSSVLSIFMIGDSYFASGELSGYFDRELSHSLGKAGESLLSVNKKFPASISTSKTFIRSSGPPVRALRILTSAGADQISLSSNDGKPLIAASEAYPDGGILFRFKEPVSGFYISSAKNVPFIHTSGVILYYDSPGIITGYYGVVSASLRTYNNQLGNIFKVIEIYKPDILIINLGLNDCAGPNFNRSYADIELKYLLQKVRMASPGTSILYLSPPGFYSRQKKGFLPSPNIDIFRERLAGLAGKEKFAWWDMRAVMGGDTSMTAWVKAGLAVKDYIHLTSSGMSLISRLLAEAVLNLYRKEE